MKLESRDDSDQGAVHEEAEPSPTPASAEGERYNDPAATQARFAATGAVLLTWAISTIALLDHLFPSLQARPAWRAIIQLTRR